MARPSKAVGHELAEQAKAALKMLGKTGESARRLQAIIAAQTKSISLVAEIFQVSRMTLMSWIQKFERASVQGLAIKPGRGRKRKIPEDIVADIQELLTKNPNTTIKAAQHYVKERYGLEVARMTIYRVLKGLNLSHITPRPRHVKADLEAQEAFKKKS